MPIEAGQPAPGDTNEAWFDRVDVRQATVAALGVFAAAAGIYSIVRARAFEQHRKIDATFLAPMSIEEHCTAERARLDDLTA